MTITQAAATVLREAGQPLCLEDILRQIKMHKLFRFNSPDEINILREQLRRHTNLPEKDIQYDPTLFTVNSSGMFSLSDNATRKADVNMRRIRRASDKEEVIERLSKASDSLFGDIWRLLIFAATVGIHANKREPITHYDSGRSIDSSYFGGCSSWPGLLHLLGLTETEDPRVLNPDQEQLDLRVTIFEEYANAGLRIIKESGEPRDYSLDSILALIPTPPTDGPQILSEGQI